MKSVPICGNDKIFLGWQKAHMKFIRQQIDRRHNKMCIFPKLCVSIGGMCTEDKKRKKMLR